MEKLILIDGNSLLNRAFYATPVFTTKDGFPTNGIFGFVKLLLKIAADKNPEYLAVAFDLHAPTFRHKLYADYKAGRRPMPEELAVQVPVLKELLAAMNIKTVELEGYEADDVIGTLSSRFSVHAYIYTGDRDAYQLVTDKTSVCYTKRGVTDLLELSKENFKEEIGLTPSQIIDLKALMGDSSDNIPGVTGIGEKTARTLLEKYETLDGVYAHIDEIKGATQKKLLERKEQAYFSYRLATIDVNAPVEIALKECVFPCRFSLATKKKFEELEFKSFLETCPFEDERIEENEIETKNVPDVTLFKDVSLKTGIDAYKASKDNAVSCYFDEKEFRFCLKDERSFSEYVYEIKKDLLDTGMYVSELSSLLNEIFCGSKKVLVYHFKEIRKRLYLNGIDFTSPVEDVALIKHISDGSSVSETIDFALSSVPTPNGSKACGIYLLFETFFPKLNGKELELYREIELPLSYVLYDMEENGVCVDESMIEELSKKYKREAEALNEKIQALAGEAFNVNSPAQLGKILFQKLKIDEEDGRKKKKTFSTSADVLEQYAADHEIVRLILRYRKIQKLNSTYLDGFKPFLKDGKIHTTYNQTNTATGRLSSSNPNLQNIPVRTEEGKELRKLFKASKGCVLVDADYSQIELRLLAHFADCEALKKAYNEHADIHALTASQVFGVPVDKVTPSMRRSAKAVNFGIIYGISSFGLSKDLSVPPKKAKEYIDKYFKSYPGVKEYMDGNVSFARANGYVTTLSGRRRVIEELNASNHNLRSFGERAAMNMPLQGSSADIIKIAMLRVKKQLEERRLKAKLVLQIHDELIIDCPKNEQAEVSALLKEEMEHAVALSVPLEVDVGVGENWFEAH